MEQQQIKKILAKWRKGETSLREEQLLEAWYELLIATGEIKLTEIEKNDWKLLIYKQIENTLDQEGEGANRNFETIRPIQKVHFIRRSWWVAASIAGLLLLGSYWLYRSDSSIPEISREITDHREVKAPETNRATIMLADGKTIYLDSSGNGQLAVQGGVQLVKNAEGQISYQQAADGNQPENLLYNILSNPNGSKIISMRLSDGSKVWLNAGSSVRYPVVFAGKERKLSINGEIYFEVAHNSSMPFKVVKGETEIIVLGTHFNVNAYDDEKDIRVTLLEGSVKVRKGNSTEVLKPGQQAAVGSGVRVLNHIDMEEVMAWKNGRFELGGHTIEPIMRQVARWYDVEIEYLGIKPEDNFMGSTSREGNVSELLKILEQTKAVRFRVEGRKIIVTK